MMLRWFSSTSARFSGTLTLALVAACSGNQPAEPGAQGGAPNGTGGGNSALGGSSAGSTAAGTAGQVGLGGAQPQGSGGSTAGANPGTGGQATSSGGASGGGGVAGAATFGGGGNPAQGGSSAGAAGAPTTGGNGPSQGGATNGGSTNGGSTSASGGATTASGGATSTGACAPASAAGHFQMEDLNRGLIAVRNGSGNYVGWRMFGYEYNKDTPASVSYNVYRGGTRIATVTNSTNYFDSGAAATAAYTVSAVIDGTECAQSASVTTRASNYIAIPLTPPASGTTPSGGSYSYDTGTVRESSGAVNDGSPGDVDGDGEYEIFVTWQPSNAQDNSVKGYTGPTYLDCYKLNGTRLWRLNLGINIRAGAHYAQFVVYDFDGDGKAEVALRTAPGTRDGKGEFLKLGPAASDNDATDYRNADGYVLSGPEYLTVFDGLTGAELATENFQVPRGTVSAWGDSYGNRVDRFLASAGFVSDTGSAGQGSGRPAILMGRGYYTRSTVAAWSYRDGKLTRIWQADSSNSGQGALAGQGAHSMVVADVDNDNAQEILYGAAMIQSNGLLGCATGFGHGDAIHVGDFILSRPGLEMFMPHEDTSKQTWDIRDANSCAIIHSSNVTGSDNGRGICDDISPANPGAEFWSSADTNMRSATTGASLGAKPNTANFVVWWDADESRELLDGTVINKGDANNSRVFTCSGCMSNNHTKATPTLTADLFGDWREEVIWRTPTSNELRVYTTTDVTTRRIYTLMHDPQYRMQVTSEQTAYNQPPHPSFHIGSGMANPPKPNILVK